MEYQKDALATFNDSKEIFKIKKHIQSCGKTYTCATGKRARIRNVEKFTQIPNDFAVNSQKGIIPIGKPVYEKEENPANIDELIQIVKEANKKRHPLPKSPFEKHEVDWHWSLIWELEKYNPVIKEVRKEGDNIIIELTGNGFLYNMVRIISGTLLDVGLGKIKSEEIPEIIESKDRQRAGRTLPAHGLYLVQVVYN